MRRRCVSLLLISLLPFVLGAQPAGDFSLEEELARLGHEEFKVRVAAQGELSQWGKEHLEEGLEVFYKNYRASDDPEIRARCRELLKELVVISQAGEGEGYIGIMMQEDNICTEGDSLENFSFDFTPFREGIESYLRQTKESDEDEVKT